MLCRESQGEEQAPTLVHGSSARHCHREEKSLSLWFLV